MKNRNSQLSSVNNNSFCKDASENLSKVYNLFADKYNKEAFSTVIQAKRFNYDNENNPIQNYVFALSSVEFIHGDYSETSAISNKNIAFKVAERAVGAEDTGISFVTKRIENESFATEVTEATRNIVLIVFMIMLPVAMIAAGIYVYIRRKNS